MASSNILLSRIATNALLRRNPTSASVVATAWRRQLPQAVSTSLTTSPLTPRTFSTKAKTAKSKTDTTSGALEKYLEEKRAKKAVRAKQFAERQAHKEVVKRRRDGRDRGKLKRKFNAWFLPQVRQNRWVAKQHKEAPLKVSVVLERLPVIVPDPEPWEKDWDLLRTYLDQFGRQLPDQLTGGSPDDEIIEDFNELTDEALLKHLPKGVTLAPRETEADFNGDIRTLDRRLKTWLFLFVKKDANDPWNFPTVTLKPEETFKEATQRAIQETIGDALDIWYVSNCPMAVQVDPNDGTKTFYMVIQYDDGKLTKDNILVDDFAWLEKPEAMEELLKIQADDNDDDKKRKDLDQTMFYHYLLHKC